MLAKLGSHVRHHVVGYIALFFALTGVAYAAGPLKSGDPAGGDLTGTYPNPIVVPGIARDSEIVPTVLGNDGSGSGLDADKLDGLDSTDFLSAGTSIGVGAFMGRIEDLPSPTNPDDNTESHYFNPEGLSTGAGSATTSAADVGFLSPNHALRAQDLIVRTTSPSGPNTARGFSLTVPGVADPVVVACLMGEADTSCNSGEGQTLSIPPGSRVLLEVLDICTVGAVTVCPDPTDVMFGWRATMP